MGLTIKILIGVFIMTIVGLVAFQFIGGSLQPQVVGNSSTSVIGDMYKVEISGEINNAGIYYVEIGATLDDLINTANGTTKNADELCFNYDLTLEDNASYYIAPIYDIDDICGNEKLKKYNINNCSQDDLENIEGIGESISTSIVNYRKEIGSFLQLEDVMKVNGIGNSTFSKLKNYIRLKD